MRPDRHALVGTDTAGDQQVAERQQELARIDADLARLVGARRVGAVEVQHRLVGPHVDLVAAHEGELVLELDVHRLVAGQGAIGDEAQVRRIGGVDDAEAVAAVVVRKDDEQRSVIAPELRPVAARSAGGEHVEQHRIGRVADVVRGDAGATLIAGVDQQVAEQERVSDDAGEAEMVPRGEALPIEIDLGVAGDLAVAPEGPLDEPGSKQTAAHAGAGEVGEGCARDSIRTCAGHEGPRRLRRPIRAEHEILAAVEVAMRVDRHRRGSPRPHLDRLPGVGDVPGAHLKVGAGLARGNFRHREEDAVVVGEDRGPALLWGVQPAENFAGCLGHVRETRRHRRNRGGVRGEDRRDGKQQGALRPRRRRRFASPL